MKTAHRLAAALGIALVMTSSLIGLAEATDFIPVLNLDPTDPPRDPPNKTANKGTTTGPSRGN